jgi:hypothetical protein
MAIPFFFDPSYDSLFNFYFLINSASLVVSFWVVKKYFDFGTAFIVTALQSTHLLYIEAIAFPINPTFLLPLIPFLLWAILEFSLNKNEKALPYFGLIISLGIQIHLSIATFLLVPFMWCIIYRVRVSIKTIFQTILISLTTFLPFIYFSFNSYKAPLFITHVTKLDLFSSFFEPFKILTVQNTINRLTDFSIGQGNLANFINVSKFFTLIQFGLLNLSLLAIVLFIFFNIKKRGTKSYQKGIIVFLFFYCPALVYDIIRPWDRHFWYNYIFILPAVLLVSISLVKLKKFLAEKQLTIFFKLTTTSLILYILVSNVLHFNKVKNLIQNSSKIGEYQNFNVTRKLQTIWSNELNIPIKKIYKNVYIENFQNPSANLFYSSNIKKKLELGKNTILKNDCFYVINKFYIIQNHQKFYGRENKSFNLFLQDLSIERTLTKDVLMEDKGLNKLSKITSYRIYKYKTKLDQPCYNNSSQTFPSSLYDEKLLHDYLNFQKNGQNILERKIFLIWKKKINELKLKYIVKNNNIKYPIRFLINIDKTVEGYRLNVVLDFFSWGVNPFDQFIFKELDLYLVKGAGSKKIVNKFNIISKNSFISHGLGINKEKFHWYRNFTIGQKIISSDQKLSFKISAKLKFPNRKKTEIISFDELIPIEF